MYLLYAPRVENICTKCYTESGVNKIMSTGAHQWESSLLEGLVHGSRATGQAGDLLTPPLAGAAEGDQSLAGGVWAGLSHVAGVGTRVAAELAGGGAGLFAVFCLIETHPSVADSLAPGDG